MKRVEIERGEENCLIFFFILMLIGLKPMLYFVFYNFCTSLNMSKLQFALL